MRVALDATYSVDAQPTGIAVYSSRLLAGMAAEHPSDLFFSCFRPRQFTRAPRPAYSNLERRLLAPPLLTFRADIFHALNQRVDRRQAKNVVSTFHDLFVISGKYSTEEFRDRFRRQATEAAQRSDLIITVSEFTAWQLSEFLKVKRSVIRVVPHGVDRPSVIPPIAAREPLILFVGALQLRKNITRLVEAFRFVPETWRLILAGAPTGFGAQSILAAIGASPVAERIEVTGYINADQLNNLYSRASIFAFPSLDEGFGIPVLEAMAWGVPVLTSNRSALPEIAESAALLVDPGKIDEITSALVSLTSDESLRGNLAVKGRERAKKFTWRATVAKTYAVYRELLGLTT